MSRLALFTSGVFLVVTLTADAQTTPPSPTAGAPLAPPVAGQAPLTPAAPPGVIATSPDARVFASEVGAILNPINPLKTVAFEAVLVKLKEALRLSKDPVRRQQAQGWKVYRVAESGDGGTVYYLFLIDPVVKGADYTITTVLRDAYPTEIDALLEQFLGAYAGGQTLMNMRLVANMKPQ